MVVVIVIIVIIVVVVVVVVVVFVIIKGPRAIFQQYSTGELGKKVPWGNAMTSTVLYVASRTYNHYVQYHEGPVKQKVHHPSISYPSVGPSVQLYRSASYQAFD